MELIFWALAEAIGTEKLGAVDMGGSVFIHTFGAYFGVACSYVMGGKKAVKKWGSKPYEFEAGNYIS